MRRPNFALALAFAALLFALAAPSGAQAPQEGTPRAVFDATEVDAGEVTRGKDITFTFSVRNTGDGILQILSAKPG